MNMYLELILLVLCTNTHTSAGSKTRQEVLAQLLKDYDPDVYPNDRNGNQTQVTVQLTIADIDQVNDQTMEFGMILYLRLGWYDPKLQFLNETNITFTNIELTGDNTKKVWLPDLFFLDERKASSHGIMGPQKLLYIYQDGNVSFSERITMTTECAMSFENFPFDEQKCILHLESYAYTINSLVLKWAPYDEAVQNIDTNTPLFTITHIETTSGINSWSSFSIYKEMRNFSYLNATLTLKRHTSVYWFSYFGTYSIYVSVVLISFGFKETSARVSACTTAFIALAIQWITVYSKLPSIPHFTVIDKWILMHVIWVYLVIFYHMCVHLWIRVHEARRSRFNERSEKSTRENNDQSQTEAGAVSSSASTVSKWIVTLKKAQNENDGNIKAEPNMIPQRSYEDFSKLDEYLRNKIGNYSANSEDDDLIDKMVKLLQPENISKNIKDQNVQQVIKSFISDRKWKCPTTCSEKCEGFLKFFRELLESCKRWCKEKECCENCCNSSGYQPCCPSCCRCCCCKDKVVFLKKQSDGSFESVKGEKQMFINRSFKDFYYLQTYLQAKYPEFKWPRIPLHNVLTVADQRDLKTMREEYISEMVQLLQPNVWRHHSEIENVMQTFIAEDEWKGSKWYSCYRLYIVNFVDTAGNKTGPDLIAFIISLLVYIVGVPVLLQDKWEDGKLFNISFCVFAFIVIIAIVAKYRSIMPPTLWHTHAKTESNTNRNEQQNGIEAEPRNDSVKKHPNEIEMLEIANTTWTHETNRTPRREGGFTDKSKLMENSFEPHYQSTCHTERCIEENST